MKDISKYQGIIPAFYACYDDNGAISPERVEALTKYMIKKGVKAFMSAVLPVNVFTRELRNVNWFLNM